jgi:two-component system sensor histidine kinase KdpD
LKSLADESHRLAHLVDNLLDMARLDSGGVALNRQWHVLEELVGVAVARMQPELREHSVQVDIPAEMPLLSVDGDLMSQLLANLLENAVRYTPAGSAIQITARVVGRRAEIKVADNGPGLPAGSESHVFDKFFRGATATADGRRGVGLGLAICQSIVSAHGGEIRAANRLGGGAEFTISLPCDSQPPAIVVEQVPASATHS